MLTRASVPFASAATASSGRRGERPRNGLPSRVLAASRAPQLERVVVGAAKGVADGFDESETMRFRRLAEWTRELIVEGFCLWTTRHTGHRRITDDIEQDKDGVRRIPPIASSYLTRNVGVWERKRHQRAAVLRCG